MAGKLGGKEDRKRRRGPSATSLIRTFRSLFASFIDLDVLYLLLLFRLETHSVQKNFCRIF